MAMHDREHTDRRAFLALLGVGSVGATSLALGASASADSLSASTVPDSGPSPAGPVNAQSFGAVGDGVADDTAALQRALDAVKLHGDGLYIPAGTYRVSNLALDYSKEPSQPAAGAPYGFAAPQISGAGSRRTVLQQISGATGDVLTVRGKLGAAAGPGHNNKVTGLDLHDIGIIGTPSGGHGLLLESIVESSFRSLRIRTCGGSGIYFAREYFAGGVSDEYLYGLEFTSVKALANARYGFECSTTNSVTATLLQCDASANGLGGYLLAPCSLTMIGCFALANGHGKKSGTGLRAVANTNHRSVNAALSLIGCRFEGNGAAGGYDVRLDAGQGYSIVGCSFFSTAGAHCIGIGVSASKTASGVYSTVISGGSFGGDGKTRTQRAIVAGGKSHGTTVMSPYVAPATFAIGGSSAKDFLNLQHSVQSQVFDSGQFAAAPKTRTSLQSARRSKNSRSFLT